MLASQTDRFTKQEEKRIIADNLFRQIIGRKEVGRLFQDGEGVSGFFFDIPVSGPDSSLLELERIGRPGHPDLRQYALEFCGKQMEWMLAHPDQPVCHEGQEVLWGPVRGRGRIVGMSGLIWPLREILLYRYLEETGDLTSEVVAQRLEQYPNKYGYLLNELTIH